MSDTTDTVEETAGTVGAQVSATPANTVKPPRLDEPTEVNHYDSSNALYDRLYRLTKPHRWWVVVAVGLGLLVGFGQVFPYLFRNTALMSGAFSRYYFSIVALSVVASIVAPVGAFLSPILIAVVGASLTARETTLEGYELILLTDLTNSQIVRAYMRISFKRTQMLWAFYLGLTIPALIGLVFTTQLSYYGDLIYQLQSLITLLIRLPWVLLGLVWGVWVAQRVRTPSGGILAAVIGMFITQLIYSIASTFLLTFGLLNSYRYFEDGSQITSPGNEVAMAFIGIALALMIPVLASILYVTLPARVRRRT